jgi:hypothetical protein
VKAEVQHLVSQFQGVLKVRLGQTHHTRTHAVLCCACGLLCCCCLWSL